MSAPTRLAHAVPDPLPAHTIDYALSGSFADVVKYGLPTQYLEQNSVPDQTPK